MSTEALHSSSSEIQQPLSTHAQAFLSVLRQNVDHVVFPVDLEELTDLNWKGKITDSWNELFSHEELSPYLLQLGRDAVDSAYVYTSSPNDPKRLKEITNWMIDYMENPKRPGDYVQPNTLKKWKAVAAALGSLTSVAAVVAYKKSRISKTTKKSK